MPTLKACLPMLLLKNNRNMPFVSTFSYNGLKITLKTIVHFVVPLYTYTQ